MRQPEKMVSTTEQQDLATLFPGVQPLSHSDPVQIVSLRDVNNEDSTTYPPHQQQLPLPAFNPAVSPLLQFLTLVSKS